MLTIALNEYGDFHHLGQKKDSLKHIHFITGIVYDDEGSEQDLRNEQIRLDRFFRAVAEASNSDYPQGFFGDTKEDDSEDTIEAGGSIQNSSQIRRNMKRYRDALDAALPEFLADGTYKGQNLVGMPRIGHYAITLMLKSEAGKKQFLRPYMSELLHDGVASNLYWHMADSLVSRLVLSNPFALHNNRVQLHLASQLVDVKETEYDRLAEYRRLGYKPYDFQNEQLKKEGIITYQVGNDFTYRAALDRRMIEFNRPDLDVVQLKSVSVQYDDDRPETTANFAFLYLAGHICGNFIYYGAERDTKDIFKFKTLVDFANQINPKYTNYIFVYDDIDTYFEQAMKAYHNEDYYGALCHLYDGKCCDSKFKSYYETNWFPFVEELIHSVDNREAIERAIESFVNYANQSRLDEGKLHYLYQQLEYILEDIKDMSCVDKALVYAFYDGGMTAFNHLGKSDVSVACFEKCQALTHTVPLETYMETVRRRIVAKIDCYKYEEALELAKYVVDVEEQIQHIRDSLPMGKQAISLGQSYSQLGQVYAYMERPEAESYFLPAIDIFTVDTDDYYRTVSYLLHYYIDAKQQDSYERWAPNYFGGHPNMVDQLAFLLNMTSDEKIVQHESYALYVYIKALYQFYRAGINKELMEALIKLGRTVGATLDAAPKGHPWELIFIYLALLAYEKGYKVDAEYFRSCIERSVVNAGPAISNIMTYGELRFAQCKGNQGKYEILHRQLSESVENVEKYMTYMFR
ncbi:hypothetical protein [uncultured Veillonella sp.]|uniref:hypothetical protein n=1 Tax=uncultured Veillonella sp. TaxID=159268 RepID=UPI0025F43DBB|nr:hypothetical protein [uncultured Veillonella sp.]